MNWEALGAIAELVGAAAVVLTLIYLSVQVRQNTKAMNEAKEVELARNHQQLAELRVRMISPIAESAELSDVYAKFQKSNYDLEELSEGEIYRIGAREMMNAITNSVTFYQYERGLVDRKSYESSKMVVEKQSARWKSLGIDPTPYHDWIKAIEERDA